MKDFALIGAGGYIAPRHLTAIRDTGNRLVAALDPHDSVGILDSYFPETRFFTEFERFDRHLDKRRRAGEGVEFISIASPNYLHDSHCRLALRLGAAAICEKPLVINPWNVDALAELEKETGGRIHSILQLRLHPAVIALREKVRSAPGKRFSVDLDYVTSRGHWYLTSWKGDDHRSGGIVTNIGIHFFDMLLWIFGPARGLEVMEMSPQRASGRLDLDRADVTWRLSVEASDLPAEAIDKGARTFRAIRVDGEEVEFSEGFTDLHTESYREILAGRGFGLDDARPAIELVHDLRHRSRA